MQVAICLLSVVPMRKEPSHRSEMVSQLLFGEFVETVEEKDDFVFVRCLYDGYEGWVQANQLTLVADEQVRTTYRFLGNATNEVTVDGNRRLVPFAVPIYYPPATEEALQFGDRQVNYPASQMTVWKSVEKVFSKENLDAAIKPFLDTPYLWGGKSVYGIDCSGFAQQVFKLFSVALLRDAYLQAAQGSEVDGLDKAQLGDLAFFQNEQGRVTHVGILLEKNAIVHASGKVRIDTVDQEGIINCENGKRTHHFHSIRRFF